MPEFERTVTVPASPDNAFQYLGDPRNLTAYVAEMVLARPEGGDRMRVAAEVQGRHEEGEAHFRADASERRLEWGGQDASSYQGWLQVSDANAGSTVTIHLHVAHEHDEAEINRALDETVTNIERLLGGR